MRKHKDRNNSKLLPFRVIEAATNGDVHALNMVLKHFESYIIALSTRPLFDEQGGYHFVIDTDRRRTLETKLIVKMMQFNISAA